MPHRRSSNLSLLIFATTLYLVLMNLLAGSLYIFLRLRASIPAKWRTPSPTRGPSLPPSAIPAARSSSSSSAPPPPPLSPAGARQRALLETMMPAYAGARYPAYVIALDPAGYDAAPLRGLGAVRNLTVITANNGSDAAGLPLYTRHVLRHGRSEHHQLGNAAAVGCLYSHADAWGRVAASGRASIVFEEDVVVAPDSDARLARFLESMEPYPWDVLMLDPGHLNSGGPWSDAGPLGANCSAPGACEWFGTRAYAVRPEAARRLLAHSSPPVVQADALISLVYEFYPDAFRMYWTRRRIFGYDIIRRSTIFDWCIKCYLPVGGPAYVLAGTALAVTALSMAPARWGHAMSR